MLKATLAENIIDKDEALILQQANDIRNKIISVDDFNKNFK